MSYTGKKPDFDAIVIEESAVAVDAPAEGAIKFFVKNGRLYKVDSSGAVKEVDAANLRLLTYFLS